MKQSLWPVSTVGKDIHMKLSVVVPCYNEAGNIPLVLEKFRKAVHRPDIEVILVDNGSRDHTGKVLEEKLPDYPFARSIRVDVNRGYGYGILQGLKACRGEFIGWTHADMQTDPADLIRAFRIIENRKNPENIYIKGLRKGRPFTDQFFAYGMSIFETVCLGVKLYDVNAQPNLFSRQFFETWKHPPKDFNLDLYALYQAQAQHMQVIRFEVKFPKRIWGHSSWNTGWLARRKLIKSTVSYSMQLRKEKDNGIYRT